MSTMPINPLVNAIATLLTEAYAGPPDPSATWFIDNEPNSGILGLLETINAAQASASADGSGQPGTSIASHAEHLRWSLANANDAMRGKPYQGKWAESWHLSGAEESQWANLQQELRAEFESARELIQAQQDLPGEYLLGVLALIPHAAYHLGVIRQMIERVKSAG